MMVKIVELYLVGGGWRHDATKDRDNQPFPAEPLKGPDMNSSWMDDEMSTSFSMDAASPLHNQGRLNILSNSALEFIGSPGRAGQAGRKLLLPNVESRDEGEKADGERRAS